MPHLSDPILDAAAHGGGGDGDVEPAVAPGASKGETVILFNGYPVRVQPILQSDPARAALGPFIGRYLDNGEIVQIPPGDYIGNDKKRYELGANGRITQGGNVSQSDYDGARGTRTGEGATGGDSGGPSRVGVQAPDPYGAALIRQRRKPLRQDVLHVAYVRGDYPRRAEVQVRALRQ